MGNGNSEKKSGKIHLVNLFDEMGFGEKKH